MYRRDLEKTMAKRKKKTLVFIVAYNAERHIAGVLDRIPPSFLSGHDYEILIIDDSSSDRTFAVSKRYQSVHRKLNLKVLWNPGNLGYGGNQKLGYRYALENGFDAVVLLHGDGQYAPECLEEMLQPIVRDEADAVLGSRMIEKRKALRGGMPLYKFVGNIILTGIQNLLLGSRLSEFHSGYRAFSTRILRTIPFERNTDDFHFDTQILIQCLLTGGRIREVAIPTYYGGEICHVNGLRYAWDVMKTTLLSRAQKYSILYQPEYDLGGEGNAHYTPKFGYPSSHTLALEAVPPGSTVLEIGCGQGFLLRELKKKGCYAAGVDRFPLTDPTAADEFHRMNLEAADRLPNLDRFDYILLLDVLEHLDSPEEFLEQLRIKTKRRRPTVLITSGNVAFAVIRLQLLFAQFNYGKQGILDLTHKRLFTFWSLARTCRSSGYKILFERGIPVPFPKAFGRTSLSMAMLRINEALICLSRTLFSYQIYLEAVPTPVVSELLELAVAVSSKRRGPPESETRRLSREKTEAGKTASRRPRSKPIVKATKK